MKKNNITCNDVMHHICDKLGEDLSSSKCKLIKSHIESCDKCSNYFDSLKITINLFQREKLSLSDDSINHLLKSLDLK